MENQQPQADSMTLEAFRQMKESGINPYEQMGQADAAPDAQEGSFEGDNTPEDIQEPTDDDEAADDQMDASADVDDDSSIEVPENQKTAFQKALEREKRKAREAAEEKVRKELESQFNPYKAFFDRMGIQDPQQAMEMLDRQQLQQQAQQMAYEQGWTDDQAQMWVRQQELEKKQTEMQVDLQLYQLEETKKYPGIRQMKSEITAFIRQNPRATAEQAYFAVGGPNLLQQMKRESEQREIAKRSQTKRTVITDAPTDMKGPEPLNADEVRFMRRTGMSEAQFRAQYKGEGPQTLEDYRRMKKKG